jgi:hypothetical protein
MASPSPQKEEKNIPTRFLNDADEYVSAAGYIDKTGKRATPQDATKALKSKDQASSIA